MDRRRALHFVFKIINRKATISFFEGVLGMKVLRHEEFAEGCKAYCNGPYDGKWSKTMIGYGPEDNHFVMELTYNYGIGSYTLGTDFRYIEVNHKEAFDRISNGVWPVLTSTKDSVVVEAPGGYHFIVRNMSSCGDPVKFVCLSSANLTESVDYWARLCQMKLISLSTTEAVFRFAPNQCQLKLALVDEPVQHATAFGRIAFSCPREQLPSLQARMTQEAQKILKPLVSLDTPGKATVEVVILADPDGHEICFVGDEAFRELSQVDPKADGLLRQAIDADKSDEWFKKHGGKAEQ